MSFIGLIISIVLFALAGAVRSLYLIVVNQLQEYAQSAKSKRTICYTNIAAA
jgi:hypothetical protein